MGSETMHECHKHSHRPEHMAGWEAFGVTGGAPTVRRLGFIRRDGTIEPGTTRWGKGETDRGCASIEIHSHADPTDGYIYVCGPTRSGVERVWRQADKAFGAFRDEAWA